MLSLVPYERSVHIINDNTFSVPIHLKHKTSVAFFYISYFLLTNLSKSHIWSATPKTKTRVHPRHDSRKSDDTPLWIRNDRAHPTSLISSTFAKNWPQNRNIRAHLVICAGNDVSKVKTQQKLGQNYRVWDSSCPSNPLKIGATNDDVGGRTAIGSGSYLCYNFSHTGP